MDTNEAKAMVASLRSDRDEVRRKIEELEARRESYDKTINGLMELYFLTEEELHNAGEGQEPQVAMATEKTLREFIEEFFDLHEGDWVTTREIHDGVVKLGWTTRSKNSIAVLRNTLGPIVQSNPRIQRRQRDDQQMLHRWVPADEITEGPVGAGPSGSAIPLRDEGGDEDADHGGDHHRPAVTGGFG